jgi:hypothetical protein
MERGAREGGREGERERERERERESRGTQRIYSVLATWSPTGCDGNIHTGEHYWLQDVLLCSGTVPSDAPGVSPNLHAKRSNKSCAIEFKWEKNSNHSNADN